MKTKSSYLAEIERLRAKHTQNAAEGKWQKNETVRQKIKLAWGAYHNAPEKIGGHADRKTQRLDFIHWLSLCEKMRHVHEIFPLAIFEKKYAQGMSPLSAVESFRR